MVGTRRRAAVQSASRSAVARGAALAPAGADGAGARFEYGNARRANRAVARGTGSDGGASARSRGDDGNGPDQRQDWSLIGASYTEDVGGCRHASPAARWSLLSVS